MCPNQLFVFSMSLGVFGLHTCVVAGQRGATPEKSYMSEKNRNYGIIHVSFPGNSCAVTMLACGCIKTCHFGISLVVSMLA